MPFARGTRRLASIPADSRPRSGARRRPSPVPWESWPRPTAISEGREACWRRFGGTRAGQVAYAGIGVAIVLAGCAEPAADPLVERGRQVYLAQCLACHGPDPARDGALGPAVTGSSQALLEAKVLRGEYPAGYAPKRGTTAMPPMPALEPDIPALAAYLQ